jgi:hypothetical protein
LNFELGLLFSFQSGETTPGNHKNQSPKLKVQRPSFRGVAQRPEPSIDNRAMSVQFLPPRPKSLPISDLQLPIDGTERREISIGNRQSEIGNALRDGVNGNTLRFERRDEGPTPSPAAKILLGALCGKRSLTTEDTEKITTRKKVLRLSSQPGKQQ